MVMRLYCQAPSAACYSDRPKAPDDPRPRPGEALPVISAFFGIVIRMYYVEHEPPHFHAEYDSQQASFGLDGTLLAGNIRSRTARRLIREWTRAHADELLANWQRMRAGRRLEPIDPLE